MLLWGEGLRVTGWLFTRFAGYCLLVFEVAYFALWRESLFFGCPKKSNQKKGHPIVAFRFAKYPVLLVLAGLG